MADGIKYFKMGRQTEAIQYLNKALQIDETNVEALTARGALYVYINISTFLHLINRGFTSKNLQIVISQHISVHYFYLISSLLKHKIWFILKHFWLNKVLWVFDEKWKFYMRILLRIDNDENLDEFLNKEHYSIGMQTMKATTKQWKILKKHWG